MEDATRRRPGRPRSQAARRAILRASLELAGEHGPRGVSMDAIARRASVSKETLYRWWRSKAEVLLEASAERGAQEIPVPDTGTLRVDLRRFLRATADAADEPTLRLLRSIAAEAAADAGFADLARERFLSRRRDALTELLDRAVQRGELSAARAATALDLVFGSLWYRVIFGVGAIDHRWADGVADAVSALATAPRRPRPGLG
jgi:AcrR family transcriptional regulator